MDVTASILLAFNRHHLQGRAFCSSVHVPTNSALNMPHSRRKHGGDVHA